VTANPYQCPVCSRIKFCSAVVDGKCKYGFTAVDKKGNCVRKKKGGVR
jgi:hypothetical protein